MEEDGGVPAGDGMEISRADSLSASDQPTWPTLGVDDPFSTVRWGHTGGVHWRWHGAARAFHATKDDPACRSGPLVPAARAQLLLNLPEEAPTASGSLAIDTKGNELAGWTDGTSLVTVFPTGGAKDEIAVMSHELERADSHDGQQAQDPSPPAEQGPVTLQRFLRSPAAWVDVRERAQYKALAHEARAAGYAACRTVLLQHCLPSLTVTELERTFPNNRVKIYAISAIKLLARIFQVHVKRSYRTPLVESICAAVKGCSHARGPVLGEPIRQIVANTTLGGGEQTLVAARASNAAAFYAVRYDRYGSLQVLPMATVLCNETVTDVSWNSHSGREAAVVTGHGAIQLISFPERPGEESTSREAKGGDPEGIPEGVTGNAEGLGGAVQAPASPSEEGSPNPSGPPTNEGVAEGGDLGGSPEGVTGDDAEGLGGVQTPASALEEVLPDSSSPPRIEGTGGGECNKGASAQWPQKGGEQFEKAKAVGVKQETVREGDKESDERWWRCMYGHDSRSLIVANRRSVSFLTLARKERISVEAERRLLDLGTEPRAGAVAWEPGELVPQKTEAVCALARCEETSGGGRFLVAVATTYRVLLWDTRRTSAPLLQWDHCLSHAPPHGLILPAYPLGPSPSSRAILAFNGSGDVIGFAYAPDTAHAAQESAYPSRVPLFHALGGPFRISAPLIDRDQAVVQELAGHFFERLETRKAKEEAEAASPVISGLMAVPTEGGLRLVQLSGRGQLVERAYVNRGGEGGTGGNEETGSAASTDARPSEQTRGPDSALTLAQKAAPKSRTKGYLLQPVPALRSYVATGKWPQSLPLYSRPNLGRTELTNDERAYPRSYLCVGAPLGSAKGWRVRAIAERLAEVRSYLAAVQGEGSGAGVVAGEGGDSQSGEGSQVRGGSVTVGKGNDSQNGGESQVPGSTLTTEVVALRNLEGLVAVQGGRSGAEEIAGEGNDLETGEGSQVPGGSLSAATEVVAVASDAVRGSPQERSMRQPNRAAEEKGEGLVSAGRIGKAQALTSEKPFAPQIARVVNHSAYPLTAAEAAAEHVKRRLPSALAERVLERSHAGTAKVWRGLPVAKSEPESDKLPLVVLAGKEEGATPSAEALGKDKTKEGERWRLDLPLVCEAVVHLLGMQKQSSGDGPPSADVSARRFRLSDSFRPHSLASVEQAEGTGDEEGEAGGECQLGNERRVAEAQGLVQSVPESALTAAAHRTVVGPPAEGKPGDLSRFRVVRHQGSVLGQVTALSRLTDLRSAWREWQEQKAPGTLPTGLAPSGAARVDQPTPPSQQEPYRPLESLGRLSEASPLGSKIEPAAPNSISTGLSLKSEDAANLASVEGFESKERVLSQPESVAGKASLKRPLSQSKTVKKKVKKSRFSEGF